MGLMWISAPASDGQTNPRSSLAGEVYLISAFLILGFYSRISVKIISPK